MIELKWMGKIWRLDKGNMEKAVRRNN